MIRHRALPEVLEDLRFALEVMEERAHIGLDDQAASTIRGRLLKRIAHIEATIIEENERVAAPAAVLELPE